MKKLLLTVLLCLSMPLLATAAIRIHYYRAVDEIHAVSYYDFNFPEKNLRVHVEMYRAKMEFKQPYAIRNKEDNFNLLILRLSKHTAPYKFKSVHSLGLNNEQYEIPIDANYFNIDGSGFASRAELIVQLQPDNETDTAWLQDALATNKLTLLLAFEAQEAIILDFPTSVLAEWNTLFSPEYNETRMQNYIQSKYG